MSFNHEKTVGHDEWLTPPSLVRALGHFDLDPCSPVDRPWATAENHFTIHDDGLSRPWAGRVWMNPPYGQELGLWLERLSVHGNGIALVFARTDTVAFHSFVWGVADAILFLKGRIRFCYVDGREADPCGAPSILIAYGKSNADVLEQMGIDGFFVPLRKTSKPHQHHLVYT